jgi:DNA-binding SARP family transcriptional activator
VLRVDLFGPLRVTTPSGVLGPRDFPGVKPKQILEVLVAERGHGVSKARLADALWGEALPRNYLATLETYISVMRQALEPGVKARESVVMTEHGGYHLDLERLEVDLDAFDRLLREASTAEPFTALRCLERALALVRGAVLEDEPYTAWAEDLRSAYRQKEVSALIDLGRLQLLTGEAAAALASAERAVELNPLAEAAYQVQMTASYALWRQEDALQAFDKCRRLLADELGVDPLHETVAIHLAILRHEDVATLMPRPTARDEPVRAPSRDAQLPLLGRERDLARLREALGRSGGGTFVVALVTGDTGVGKTRLVETFTEALSVPVGSNRCSDLERELPYLALSLALRPVLGRRGSDGLPLLDELLDRIGDDRAFDEFARVRAMEQLAGAVTAEAPFVLVLDAVENADAETVRTLDYLQRRCRSAPVLVVLTGLRSAVSREPLRNLRPDVRIDLDVLPESALAALDDPQLYAVTGGHPLFIDGWLKAREQGLPEPFGVELREQVVTGCWDLGPQAYRLLAVVAALDPPVGPEALATLVGGSVSDVADELDRLAGERLLDVNVHQVTFRSAPVREILRETLSPARRFLLQQQAATLSGAHMRRRATDVPDETEQLPSRRATDAPRVIDLVGGGANGTPAETVPDARPDGRAATPVERRS